MMLNKNDSTLPVLVFKTASRFSLFEVTLDNIIGIIGIIRIWWNISCHAGGGQKKNYGTDAGVGGLWERKNVKKFHAK